MTDYLWAKTENVQKFLNERLKDQKEELISGFLDFLNKSIERQEERERICRMNWDNLRKEGNLVHAQFWWDKSNVYEVIIKELKEEKEKWKKKANE